MKSRIIDFHAHVFPEGIAQKAVNHIGNHYKIKMQGKGVLRIWFKVPINPA